MESLINEDFLLGNGYRRTGQYGSDAESAAEPGCAYDDRDTDADLRGERTAGVGGRGGFPQCGTAAGAVLRMAAAL